MSEMEKSHIVVMWTVGPDDVAEGDRVFEKHAKWMTGHDREGGTALRRYNISKGPELSNPLDPSSSPTGDTIFVLSEIYESPAGVDEHWRLAVEPDRKLDHDELVAWSAKAKNIRTLHYGTVVQDLW